MSSELNNIFKNEIYQRAGLILLSAIAIYFFKDAESLLRLIPLLLVVYITYQLLFISKLLRVKHYEDADELAETLTIEDIAKRASVSIINNNDTLIIKHIFNPKNQNVIGYFIFLFGGLVMFFLAYIKVKGGGQQIFISILGLVLVGFSLVLILQQMYDQVRITKEGIAYRYQLRSKTISKDHNLHITMESEKKEARRKSPSEFIQITIFANLEKEKNELFFFQMDFAYEKIAKKLGLEIRNKIRERLEIK